MLQAIGFYLLLPIIYLVSWLPFSIFYFFSDFLYLLVYKVFGYRKKIVFDNLRNAFPDKSPKEIETLAQKFYHYLCDLILETFKTLTISKKEVMDRCTFQDISLLKKFKEENKSIILVMGHYGNWELAGAAMSVHTDYQLYVIYHALSNTYFDHLVYNMRTRFGTKLIEMKQTFREMVAKRNEVSATAFIADQTPSHVSNAYWTTFMNQDTPVYEGTEKIAKKMGYPVVYVSVKRIKRGYYKIFTELLVMDPKPTYDGEISELHTRRLEKDLLEQPETWLWSHRRWKYSRKYA